jgi:hypothetical protein
MAISIEAPRGIKQTELFLSSQQELKNLYLMSFLYSQGDTDIQSKLHTWNALNGYIDEGMRTKDFPYFLRGIRPPNLHTSSHKLPFVKEDDFYEKALRNGLHSRFKAFS